jgi:signal transduction histidine kinase/CheY-like chemotaxis protein
MTEETCTTPATRGFDFELFNRIHHANYGLFRARTEAELVDAVKAALRLSPFVSGYFRVQADGLERVALLTPPNGKELSRAPKRILLPASEIESTFSEEQGIARLEGESSLPRPLGRALIEAGCTSAAYVRVVEPGELGGLFVFGAQPGQTLSRPAIEPFISLAELLPLALDKVRARLAMQQRLRELEGISSVGQAISAASSLDTLYRIIHQQIRQTIGELSIIFALYDESTDTIRIPYRYEDGELSSLEPFPLGEGLTSILIRTRQPLMIVEDTERRAADLGAKIVGKPARSWLGCPLLIRGEAIGAIIVQDTDREGRFNEDDLRFITSLSAQTAGAIFNTRLLDEARQRAVQLQTAAEISRDVSGSLIVDELLQKSVNLIRERFSFYHAAIFLVDASGEFAAIREASGNVGIQMKHAGHRLQVGSNSIVGNVTGRGEALIVNETAKSPIYYPNPLLPDTRSEAAIPIKIGSRITGALDVQSTLPFAFNDDNIKIIQILADQIAIALVNSELYAAAQDQNKYLATAAEVGRLVTSTLDLQTLFNRAVELVRTSFGYYHAAIFTLDEVGFNAVLREATGEAGAEMKRRSHSLPVGSRSIIGQVTANGETMVVNDTANDSIFRPNPLLPETRAEAGLPLRLGSRIIGALDIQATGAGAFKPEDIAVLEILADQVAVAIENARSYDLSQKAIEELRELDKIKSQFLANMSHELRTPLNSIIGFSRVILKGIDGPISEQQQQDLSAIYNSGQHLLGLINDILDLAKIEAGKMELAFEEVNASDTIHGVMSTAMGLVKDKPIRLRDELQPDLPTIRADPMRLRQILINLLSNASKFTEEGEIVVKAGLQTSSLGVEEVLISVKDSGSGIAPEDQAKLFKAFSQVDTSPTRNTGGTGLGLSICEHLVGLHQGTIGVNSEVGRGSTFYFTIPTFRQKPPVSSGRSEKVVLCIDDDSQVITLYERFLTAAGYKVEALTNPERARQKASKIRPFAITLDIMMPGFDGWQVINDLKCDPETRDIPIIICSIVEEEEKGFSLGVADYLLKPILEDDLVHALNRLNGDGSITEVLVIDDDPDDLRLLEKIFSERSQYRPVLMHGGQKGWEWLLTHQPHAIILDLFMPDPDGFSLLERLRSTPGLRDIPVLVIGGADLSPQQKSQLENLGKRMLQKGMLDEQELFSTLERALKRIQT